MRSIAVRVALAISVLGVLTVLHIRLNHGGLDALSRRLEGATETRGELLVGHLPVT